MFPVNFADPAAGRRRGLVLSGGLGKSSIGEPADNRPFFP